LIVAGGFRFSFHVIGNICRGAVCFLGQRANQFDCEKSRESMIEYHDAAVRVRYAETDQMGVVYHANYLIWFEVGRVELIRALGIEYKRMEIEDDCHIVVADAHCRYHLSAMYDEVLRIRTRIAESRNRLVKFSYEVIRDADGKVLANGETTHVICGSNGRPKLLPKKYHTVFSSIVVPQPDRSDA
jgi:acyl-CoA thioester hydrolase